MNTGLRLLACSVLLTLGACGAESKGPGAEPQRGAGGLAGDRVKPRPALGRLVLSVIERPVYGEAIVRAEHEPADPEGTCVLELVLPEGAYLLHGEESGIVPAGPAETTWHVAFPQGAGLDLTARLCAETPRGQLREEQYLRLDP